MVRIVSIIVLLLAGSAKADVIVLANRTGVPMPVRFLPATGQPQQLTLPVGEVVPLLVDGKAQLEFSTPGNPKRYSLDANCAYFFGRTGARGVDIQKIGLGEDASTAQGRTLPGSARRAPRVTIPVKILVDEEEPARQIQWERRLRRRIEAASAILEQYSGVGLRVVAVGTWNSDNATNDFVESLAEFEREVRPSPARVAIGFTYQWNVVRGRTHMAGTRGPLHSHILVREGSPQITEPERLEFLVHELGHHLGAAHSPESDSVMRPVLGDKQAGRSDFRIRFDPVNTLAIAMIGEEMRRRNITRLYDLTPGSKLRLRQIYSSLARALPEDPAAARYTQLMSSASDTPLADAARRVLHEIVRVAAVNRALPVANGENIDGPTRREGDALTDLYVQEAARMAGTLPDTVSTRAFLLAIGVGLGDAELLSNVPGIGSLTQAVEAPSERAIRLAVLGEPTLHGRRDLAQHFFVSAYLAAIVGNETANAAGVTKELLDARGVSGLSFADIAADRAGVRFADGVLNKRVPFGMLPQIFTAAAFMPAIDNLPEGISSKALKSQFGGKDDPRFRKQLAEIDRRILALPAYQPAALQFGP